MKKFIKHLNALCMLFLLVVSALLFTGCKDEEKTEPAPETGSLTDIEGNVYRTVKIGNRWWMAENLKVKKYRNGMSIPELSSDSSGWASTTMGAYCNFDPANNNISRPGLLYNWHAVNDPGNLAPEGWHIPSDEEWKELERFLGMSPADADKAGWRGTNEGEKLKESNSNGAEYWKQYENTWATNSSGFSALAGGCRLANADFSSPLDLKSMGFWWSNAGFNSNEAWYRYLDYKNRDVFRSRVSKNYGMSIRCIKD